MTDIITNVNTIRQLYSDNIGKFANECMSEQLISAKNLIHNCLKNKTDTDGWHSGDKRRGGYSGNNSYGMYGSKTSNRNNTNNNGERNNNGFFTKNSNRHRNYEQNNVKNMNSTNASTSQTLSSTNTANVSVTNDSTVSHSAASHSTMEHSTANNNVTNTHNSNTNKTSSNSKYVSRFKKDAEKVDDMILNNIILGKLNKFSTANYSEIKEFITHIIDSGQNDLVKCFMKLVFQKAASEENFCPLYAKLISELSILYPVLYNEMNELYNKYLCIFINVNEADNANYGELLQNNIEKKYRRGYSQFLAELLKCNAIDKNIFIKTIDTIIEHTNSIIHNCEHIKMVEEYADCLMKIVKVLISENSCNENNIIFKEKFKDKIYELSIKKSENKGLSNKARFTFLDIFESLDK